MPNWCYVDATFTHNDPQMIERVKNAFIKEKLFNEFIPMPESEKENWYQWCIENWGTKWDVGGIDCECDEIDPNTLTINFSTAWSPPISAFRKFTELGFDIDATYIEEGDAYVGEYSSENDSDHYDIEERTSEWVQENIPDHLDDRYDLSSRFDEEEDWNDDEYCDEDDKN